MSNRPDLHTADHDQWDQGGYCNNLVTDTDGCGTVCGYRQPRQPLAPNEDRVRLAYAEYANQRYRTLRIDAVEDFNAFLIKVRADAVRNVATAFIDWDVMHGHSPETKASKRGAKTAAWLEAEADRMEGKQ